jgi:hypothetical protein
MPSSFFRNIILTIGIKEVIEPQLGGIGAAAADVGARDGESACRMLALSLISKTTYCANEVCPAIKQVL